MIDWISVEDRLPDEQQREDGVFLARLISTFDDEPDVREYGVALWGYVTPDRIGFVPLDHNLHDALIQGTRTVTHWAEITEPTDSQTTGDDDD